MVENNKLDPKYLLKLLSIEGEERFLALEVFRSLEGYSHLYPRADKSPISKPFAYLLSAVRSIQDLDADMSRDDSAVRKPKERGNSEVKNYGSLSQNFSSPEEFMELLSLAQEEALSERDSLIFTSRYGVNEKAKTLAEIGENFGITRERVRQLLKRSNRRILIKGKKQASIGNYESACAIFINGLSKCVDPENEGAIDRILSFIETNLAHLPINQALTLICYLSIPRDEIASKYKRLAGEIYYQRIKLREKNLKEESRKRNLEKRLSELTPFIYWPNEIKKISTEQFSEFCRARDVSEDGDGNSGSYFSDKLKKEVQYESELELNFLEILEASAEIVFYQEQPFKVPYSRNGAVKNYFPDIFFVMKNNQAIVVEIKPFLQMALQNNLDKWTSLKQFCSERGYGMLITDGRRAIQEVMRYKFNPAFAEKILSELSNGSLNWQAYKKIRSEFNIKYIDFMALVLKERLNWQLSPFKLSKQRSQPDSIKPR